MGNQFAQHINYADLEERKSFEYYGKKISKKHEIQCLNTLLDKCSNLQSLTLNNCRIKNVQANVEIHSLIKLSLSDNNLENLPAMNLPGLKHLDLSQNYFTTIPSSILNFKELETLNLSHNSISTFNDEFAQLTKIKELNLRRNSFNNFPEVILKFENLTTLNLSDNQLTDIPNNISNLKCIKELNLSNNNLQNIDMLSSLKSLTILKLRNNKLESLDDNIFESFEKLIELDLSHCKISYLPKSLFNITSLQKLKLNGNRLYHLSGEIGFLKNLTELYLQDNQLNKISKSISKCKNLEVLYCEFNSLTKLPTQLRYIKNLRYLTLHFNKFKSIPDVLLEKQFINNMYIISLEGNQFPYDLEKMINEKGTKEFLIEKLLKEEKQGTKKTNRRSLVRLASQYGTLRGRPVELDFDLSELTLNEEKQTFNNSHVRSSSAKIPDRRLLQTVFENSQTSTPNKSPEKERPKKSLNKFLSTKRMSLRNLKLEMNKDKTSKGIPEIIEEKTDPATIKKNRRLSTNLPPTKSVSNSMTIIEVLEKYKNSSIPHFSKFKDAFEDLLKQLDLKESTLNLIESMKIEDKWRFLKIYKRNLIYLLNINISDDDRNKQYDEILKSMHIYNVEKSVSYVISNISSGCGMHYFVNLKNLISYAPLKWVYEFISKGGPEIISKALKEIQMKVLKQPEDFVKENEILVSLQMISFISSDAILFSYSSMDAFLYSLKSDQMSTQRLALVGLTNILKNNPTAGLQKIISSLEKIKTFYNMPNRFSIILDVLSKSKSLQNDIPYLSFSLIHEIILSEKDPLERMLLRKEIMKFGLKEFVDEETSKCDKKENESQDLALLVVAFNRVSVSDKNHVNTLLATDYRVLQRIEAHEENLDRAYKLYYEKKVEVKDLESSTSKRHSINLGSLDRPALKRSTSMKSVNRRTSDPRRKRMSFKPIKVSIEDQKKLTNIKEDSIPEEKPEGVNEKFTGTLKVLIGDHGTTSMRIDETTTVSFIIQKILNKYPISRPEQYGFFMLSLDGLQASKGVWVDNYDTKIANLMKNFGDNGCMASYKMKPWKVPINVLFKHKTYKIDIEPSWTVEQTIAFIATNNDFSLEDEYIMNLYSDNKVKKEEDSLLDSSSGSLEMDNDKISSLEVIELPLSMTLISLLEDPYNVPIQTLQHGKKCILELTYKPKLMKITLPGNVVRTHNLSDESIALSVDYKWNQKQIIKKIMEKIPSIKNQEDYCVFIEAKRQVKKRFSTPIKAKREMINLKLGSENTSIPMTGDNNLYYYAFDTKRHYLRISLVPQSLYILLPDGNEKHIKVLFSEYVSNIINLIVKELDDTSENSGQYYCLYKDSSLLSRRKSLIDAGIEPNSHLILKKDNFEDDSSKNDLLTSKTEGEIDEYSEHFDIGIYEESDGDEFIQYEDESKTKIYAATLNKLIEKLTEPDDYDDHFMETFLFTYRSFATETELLRKIIQRYNVPDGFNKEKRETIKVRVCIFLTRWIDKEYDLIDERTLEKLNIWVENEIRDDRRDILLNTINKVRQKREKREVPIDPVNITIDTNKLINKKSPSLLDLDDYVIATQLTLDIWNIYSHLKPKDFFDRSWTDSNNKSSQISEMINRFNKISSWVATEICTEDRLKIRRNKLKRFIKIANYLKELKNYHILYAVVSGINSTSVSRMRNTFEKLGKQKQILNELENFLSMDGSFKNYRDTLNATTNTACIPYIAVLLKDLTFIEDGNANTVEGLINWSKRKLFFDVVGGYLRFIIANFKVAPIVVNGVHIKDIIDNLPCLDEQTLYDKSLLLEPRGRN